MKKAYSYDTLASSYNHRADYASEAISHAIERIALLLESSPSLQVIELGAGTGFLSRHLLNSPRVQSVLAFEPSRNMAAHMLPEVLHHPDFHLLPGYFSADRVSDPGRRSLAAFGSSFNLVSKPELQQLRSTLSKRSGIMVAYNHRDLADPLQQRINDYLRDMLDYDPGERRRDQQPLLEAIGCTQISFHEARLLNPINKTEFIQGWASHGTVQSQSGPNFQRVLAGIKDIVEQVPGEMIEIPYHTKVWTALW